MFTTEEARSIATFKEHAEEFCRVVEEPWADLGVACEQSLSSLSLLYALALRLPLAEDGDIPDNFRLTHDEWKLIFSKLCSELGVYSMYWTASDIYSAPDSKPESDMHNLDDDLADVYRSMKSGLRAWNNNADSRMDDAMYYWRYSVCFEHWSDHAVSAIFALHALRERVKAVTGH